MASNRVGLVIGGVFGLIYVVVNAAALGALIGPVLQVLGVAAFVGLLVVLYRSRQEPADPPGGAVRFGRGYWSVVAAEVVAFVAGVAVLNGPLGLPLAVLPWVTFVVGVHFLGLARVWKRRRCRGWERGWPCAARPASRRPRSVRPPRPSQPSLGSRPARCCWRAAGGPRPAAARGPDLPATRSQQVQVRLLQPRVAGAGADFPSGSASRFAREDAG